MASILANAKVLPRLEKGDSDQHVLYHSVGRALSQWESLQARLTFLFLYLCQSDTNFALFRAFGATMLVTAKLDMIDQAALAAINEEEFLGKIRSLMNRIRGFNDRRNDIAHGMVVGQASGVYLTPSHTTSKKLAVPSVQERSKHPQGRYVATSDHDAYCWTADQVDSYWLTFQSLQIEVERIREECPKYLWAE